MHIRTKESYTFEWTVSFLKFVGLGQDKMEVHTPSVEILKTNQAKKWFNEIWPIFLSWQTYFHDDQEGQAGIRVLRLLRVLWQTTAERTRSAIAPSSSPPFSSQARLCHTAHVEAMDAMAKFLPRAGRPGKEAHTGSGSGLGNSRVPGTQTIV